MEVFRLVAFPWGSGGSVQRLPPSQVQSEGSMDDVFAKSAKRVVKARDSRLRSRLGSIVLNRRHCYSTRRALIVSLAGRTVSYFESREMRLSDSG